MKQKPWAISVSPPPEEEQKEKKEKKRWSIILPPRGQLIQPRHGAPGLVTIHRSWVFHHGRWSFTQWDEDDDGDAGEDPGGGTGGWSPLHVGWLGWSHETNDFWAAFSVVFPWAPEHLLPGAREVYRAYNLRGMDPGMFYHEEEDMVPERPERLLEWLVCEWGQAIPATREWLSGLVAIHRELHRQNSEGRRRTRRRVGILPSEKKLGELFGSLKLRDRPRDGGSAAAVMPSDGSTLTSLASAHPASYPGAPLRDYVTRWFGGHLSPQGPKNPGKIFPGF